MRTLFFTIAMLCSFFVLPERKPKIHFQNEADLLRSAIYDTQKDSLIVKFRIAAPGLVVIRLTSMNGSDELLKDSIRSDKGEHERAYSVGKMKGSYVVHFRSRDIFSSRKLVTIN